MLVLSRKTEQSIMIDDEIVVRVVGVKNNRVVLSFTAPDHVRIVRGELCLRPAASDCALKPMGSSESEYDLVKV